MGGRMGGVSLGGGAWMDGGNKQKRRAKEEKCQKDGNRFNDSFHGCCTP